LLKILAGFLVVVGCTVGANLLMKTGAVAGGVDRLSILGIDWKTFAGLALFGIGGIVYAWLLRFVPLNVAQCFTALQFVGVIVASLVVLSEPISPTRWLGVALIFVGIILVGSTAFGFARNP
jgi:drug/metabolite transporter (DMT)-like permease